MNSAATVIILTVVRTDSRDVADSFEQESRIDNAA